MRRAPLSLLAFAALLAACGGDGPSAPHETLPLIRVFSGQDQHQPADSALPLPLKVLVVDSLGLPDAGATVHWSVWGGGGHVGGPSSVTDAGGTAEVPWTLGAATGGQFVIATVTGLTDTAWFHATATGTMTALAGGNNVAERYTSDLWVAGGYAYTGTWGGFPRGSNYGTAMKVWDVSSGVVLGDSAIFPGIHSVSDNEVSADGTLLLSTTEGGTGIGLYIHSLADPAHPVLVGFEAAGAGLHTGTFADIGGARYVFAAQDPAASALRIFRIQVDSADPIVPVATLPQESDYGIHDQYVRDGLAFVSVWNTGLKIYDVGNGMAGGTPAAPVLISKIVTENDGLGCACVHNAWWYHDAEGHHRYLFVGQEGPASIGSSSSGDIHVVDVADLANPTEVATFHIGGAGTHNFWVDESRGILYAAYYNAGVVALDVTGTLQGDLAGREIARLRPGGNGNTYVWGVMQANGALWVSDMLSGLWKVSLP